MREHTETLYKYDELSEDAKERALEDHRQRVYSEPLDWGEEILQSLKGLIDACDLRLVDYSLGLDRSWLEVSLPYDVQGLSGKRAMAWIENNLLWKLRIPYGIHKKYKEYQKYNPSYDDNHLRPYDAGKILPCPFTGYCADDDFLDALLEAVRDGETLQDAFRRLARTYQKIVEQEYEYQASEDYLRDLDQEYHDDGSIFRG